jgi:hypothetical protein
MVGGDFMHTEWVQTMLIVGGKKLLANKKTSARRARR